MIKFKASRGLCKKHGIISAEYSMDIKKMTTKTIKVDNRDGFIKQYQDFDEVIFEKEGNESFKKLNRLFNKTKKTNKKKQRNKKEKKS